MDVVFVPLDDEDFFVISPLTSYCVLSSPSLYVSHEPFKCPEVAASVVSCRCVKFKILCPKHDYVETLCAFAFSFEQHRSVESFHLIH
jgi:hypothetical protein